MTYTSGMAFNRSTSDFPGAITATGPNVIGFYEYAMAGQCSLACYRPTASFSNAPWLIVAKGGLGYNPGERASYETLGSDAYVRYFIERGYVVFIIDYPANPSNLDSPYAFNDIRPVAMWPDAVFWCARAIQAIKDNKDSTTPLGLKLLGSGNSIDPNYGIWWGNSWGGTIGLMLAWMPDWMVERYSTPALRRAGDQPRSSHRLKVWTAFEPQLSLVPFDIEPLSVSAKADYPLGAIYQDDKAQWLMRKDSLDKWSTTALEDKKISPWFMLKAGYPENADVLICVRWPGSPALSIPEEANLTPDNYDPEVLPTQAARDAGTAMRDPHHPAQAKTLQDELATYGNESSLCRKSIIRWGQGGTGTWANPGGAFIGQDGFAALVYNAAVTHAGYPEA